jgi:hypothetical protein
MLGNLLPKYSEVFVETGTLNGAGIHRALNSGYSRVISIELDDVLYKNANNSFYSYSNVNIVHGDSGLVLGECIRDFDESITFWLDGHYSGEGTALGISEYPLIEELTHIKNHHIKNHTILIDDIRCWKEYNASLNFNTITEFIKDINKDYIFYYMDGYVPDDILVCKIN